MARTVADAAAVLKVIAIRDLPKADISRKPKIGFFKILFWHRAG
jgi:Asp-tRNA(Asn)/Glu-tRNA(Gln) amidotransferase A subunit family amidase